MLNQWTETCRCTHAAYVKVHGTCLRSVCRVNKASFYGTNSEQRLNQ